MRLNEAAAASGMALFFTLSGFLIVRFLYRGDDLRTFALKRILRVVPLAWVAIAVLVTMRSPDTLTVVRNLLFVANVPPAALIENGGEHLWSLGVEMQFYAAVAVLCLIFGRRGLLLVPLACLLVTIGRVYNGETISIYTLSRVDEILAGGTLALLYANNRVPQVPLLLGVALLVATSHSAFGPLMYLRPYAASLLVGSTLMSVPTWAGRLLVNKPASYIADVSYAVYIFHGVLGHTWLGSGDKLTVYLKRPLLIAVTFVAAHISTNRFEKPLMAFAYRQKKVDVQGKRERP